MKYIFAISALALTAIAMPTVDGDKKAEEKGDDRPTCESHQTVVCDTKSSGGLLDLSNLLNGLLGESCSGGDVYCCSSHDIAQGGLINLNLDLSCDLNRLL